MEHAWRTALGRWGDELWGLALLRAGSRAGAQHALVQAFERVYTANTPPTDVHTAMTQALLPPRRRWLPRMARQRALPPKLRRVGPTERMLLALWLVHGHNGAELARMTQLSEPVIHDRLARALVRFLPRRNIARRTQDGWAAWKQWLGQQLQLSAEPLPDTLSPTTLVGWQQALSRVRDLITLAVGRQRLPPTVRDAIETALLARDDETPAWQQKIGFLTLATLLLAVGWIFLRPIVGAPAAQTTAPSDAPQPPPNAQTLVEHALDAWTTMPISGTLHRRVWAVDERPSARDQAQVTDVWLASDKPQYRVETTRDGKLIEWHVVDSRDRLHIAADALFNMCQWSYGPSVTTPPAQTFTVPPDQVRAIRDERLRSGSYGAGYRMLRRALQAPDLRSYGVRTEGERVLVTLGFRDEGASYTQKVLGMGPNAPARTVLLLLDGRTYALQAVRELVGDTAQTTARDLWRVDGEEMVPTVPAALPPVQGEAAVADDIIDPACPGLARDAVVSLRGLAMLPYPYGGLPIPTPLPANVVQAVLIDSVPEDTGAFVDVYNAQLVLRSADGWLQIRNSGYVENTPATSVVERGAWVVLFRDAEYSSVPLAAVVWQKDQQDPSMIYSGQSFEIEASGWTRDQVLDVVERLQPLDERTWPTLAPQFLDPHPLPADVQQVLVGAQQALATLPNGMLHVTMEATARTGRRQGERLDPYHVPSNITAPNAWTVEQWATINNTAPVQFKQIAMAWDGTLLSANVDTVAQSSWYEVRLQSVDPSSENAFSPYGYGQATFGIDLARPLLALNAPITLTADGDLWRVEQILPTTVSDVFIHGYWAQLIGNSALASVSPVDDLPLGDLVQRVSFDRAQLLPRRWELVRRTEGGEMVLQSIAVREWRRLDAPLPDGFWALPPLPDDTVLYTFDQSSAPLTGINGLDVPQPRAVPSTIDTVGGPIPITPPQRALVWPQESGFTIERNYPYRSPVTISSQWEGASFGDLLLYGSNGTGLPETGIVRSTRYELPDSTRIVTLTQGPRALLRYLLLRTGGFFGSRYGYEEPPQQSEQVQVTIAGEQHDAWLLRGPRNAALVVEIDDVLVHFTGSADYVGGVMLEQLPALEWEPVVLGQGDGGGAIEVQP